MCINYVSIISNSKSLHKSLFIEALRPRLFANHVFPRCAMGPLPARHTCQGAAESQAVFSDNHCKLFKLSQTHHPTRTSLAPHRSCFLSVTYRGSNKAFLCLLCYLLCSTDQGKGSTHVTTGSGWPPCYGSGSTDVAGLLRDRRPLQRQFLDGDRAGIKPNQTKSPFPKIHACPHKKQPATTHT